MVKALDQGARGCGLNPGPGSNRLPPLLSLRVRGPVSSAQDIQKPEVPCVANMRTLKKPWQLQNVSSEVCNYPTIRVFSDRYIHIWFEKPIQPPRLYQGEIIFSDGDSIVRVAWFCRRLLSSGMETWLPLEKKAIWSNQVHNPRTKIQSTRRFQTKQRTNLNPWLYIYIYTDNQYQISHEIRNVLCYIVLLCRYFGIILQWENRAIISLIRCKIPLPVNMLMPHC